MKNKIIALSLILAGACASINAQEAKSNYYTQKWTDNIFVGAGVNCMALIGETLWAYSANVRFDATSKGKLNPFFDLKTYFQKDIFLYI